MFIMLDSGAFSAWTKGEVVDLDEYCMFIRENIDHIDAYVALDVIPAGAKHGAPTKAATELAAEQGWRNLLYMRDVWDLDPIPVLHQGESFVWLDRMLALGCRYIGLSPRILNNNAKKQAWLDQVWGRLVGVDRKPLVKVHGFGINALPLMFRYPWHTVDAATWVKRAGYGKVMVPKTNHRTGEWDFTKIPTDVAITSKAPLHASGRFDRMPDNEKAHVLKWLREVGVTLKECATDGDARRLANAYFFKRVSNGDYGVKVFVPTRKSLFSKEDD